jgi:hypothetical protein
MKALHLNLVIHVHKRGERCGEMEPNVFEDALLMDGGKPVGFYIASVSKRSEKLSALLALANAEFRSDRVPKILLERADVLEAKYKKGITRKQAMANGTIQQSTIIGSVPPSPLFRRYTPRASNVHGAASAQPFIKSMLMAADIADTIIQEVMPEAHARQLRNIQAVPKELRFGRLWTSSISNYNISAPFHTDNKNLPESLNVIFAKRAGSTGGNLVVPDYGAVFEQPDDSMLVYPAWRNLHGVTPIKPLFPGGYRNSLILYALNLAEKPDA